LAAEVLPRVGYIALREGLASPALMASLGVPAQRMTVTGDDAVELARGLAPAQLGIGMGFNIRIADYARVGTADQATVWETVRMAAAARSAPLVPVPISHNAREDDFTPLTHLFDADGAVPPDWPAVDEPGQVCELAGRCRVVIAGSYHAGVFALSQGVSVIGLAKSDYYRGKFAGLLHEFGGGCTLVDLAGPDLQSRLLAAIERAWAEAPAQRDRLLASADTQISAGRAAFSHIADQVAPRAPVLSGAASANGTLGTSGTRPIGR
jgi:polysaccharide pyruvyl transferase WcaK-like protein